MPEHLRALVFILVLATAVLYFAKAPACALACSAKDFDRRRNLWFALTLVAFLSHNFWIYLFAAIFLLTAAQRQEPNKLALYFFVLFALPPITYSISGMGLVAALFTIDYIRLLALTLLFPAYLSLRKHPDTDSFGRSVPDKLLAGYLIFDVLLMLEHRTFTSILRDGVFYAFTDIFLPYYVASRALRDLQGFRDALMSIVVAGMVLGVTLFIEFARYWLLYQSLEGALGAMIVGADYLGRDGNLRASGTIGHAIAAGYVVAVCLGFYLYLKKVVPSAMAWGLGLLLFAAGLVGPLSRGPWVGAAAMILVFFVTGPAPMLAVARFGLLGLIAVPVLMATPYGAKIIDYLPFVGTVDESNVTGRQILAKVSYEVFWENPILGRYDFVETPAMQALKGSDGLVDLVNTYVVIALGRGIVGLSLFVGIFLVVMFGVVKGMRGVSDKNDEHHVLGRALLATLVGIMIIIATVSPVFHIPTMYWLVVGLGVGYARMLARGKVPAVAGNAPPQPAPVRRAGVRGVIPRIHEKR